MEFRHANFDSCTGFPSPVPHSRVTINFIRKQGKTFPELLHSPNEKNKKFIGCWLAVRTKQICKFLPQDRSAGQKLVELPGNVLATGLIVLVVVLGNNSEQELGTGVEILGIDGELGLGIWAAIVGIVNYGNCLRGRKVSVGKCFGYYQLVWLALWKEVIVQSRAFGEMAPGCLRNESLCLGAIESSCVFSALSQI